MALFSNFAVVVLALTLSPCTCAKHLSNYANMLVRSVHAKQHESIASNDPAKLQDSSVNTDSSQEADISKDKCTMAPESRFDCGRDRLLSQSECEERGCCYFPLPNLAGPPWCFYPSMYPGYKMGPLTPTTQGQTATLTRDNPSYLPRDISSLSLEVIEETASCLHLTVSTSHIFFSRASLIVFHVQPFKL